MMIKCKKCSMNNECICIPDSDECVIRTESYNKGYDKAIDDFVKFASDMPTVEEEDECIRPMWLEEMAKQLKAGVKE